MEQSAKTKAIGNHLILQQILKNVETPDLLNCRLVTSTNWYDLSTKLLSRRKDLQISFTHLKKDQVKDFKTTAHGDLDERDCWKKPGFFTDSTAIPWPVSELTKFVEKFGRFPCFCRRLRFSEGFIEDCADLSEFIEGYGKHIVELEVDLLKRTKVNRSVTETLGQLLMQLPNLESLTIGRVSLEWTESYCDGLFPIITRPLNNWGERIELKGKRYDQLIWEVMTFGPIRMTRPDLVPMATGRVSLDWMSPARHQSQKNRHIFQVPKLTSVKIGPQVRSDLNFLNDLKAAAPNLRVFETVSIPYSSQEVSWVINSKNLNFEVKEGNIDLFEKVARSRPQFQSVSIDLRSIKEMSGPVEDQSRLSARAAFALHKILKASRNTVEVLQNIEQLDLLPDLKIPVLPHVKCMEIRISNQFFGDQGNKEEKVKDLNITKTLELLCKFPGLRGLVLEGRAKDGKNGVNINKISTLDLVNPKQNLTATAILTSPKIWSEYVNFSPDMIRQFGQTFCLLTKLELVDLRNFAEVAPEIWTNFPKLRDFSAIMPIDKTCTMSMVQAALGVNCPQHETRETLNRKMEMQKQTRKNPSISDLADLKTVRLEFYPSCAQSRKFMFIPDCNVPLKAKLKNVLPDASITVLFCCRPKQISV